jgi:cardiolipin synthase
MPSWLNLPNLLTLARLASVPFLVQAIGGGRYRLAAALFVFAAATDMLDGLAARRMRVVSRAGAYLDPVADKIFLSAVFVALAIRGDAPLWYVAIVFGRDALILAFATVALLFTSYRKFAPSRLGKASTFFQIVAAVSLIVRGAAPSGRVVSFAAIAVVVSAAVTAASGFHYGWRAWRDKG